MRYENEEDGPQIDVSYLIDTFSNYDTELLGVTYDGPEPLNTMLDGVHYALSSMSDLKRRVDGDLVAAIGFDRSAEIPQRIFSLSPPTLTDPEFKALMDTTDLEGQALQEGDGPRLRRVRYSEHFFFPRIESGVNYPAALRKAMDMLLDDPDADNVENFVVLMSDGLTNCREDGVCGPTKVDFQNSLDDSLDILLGNIDKNITESYVEKNIHFHVLFFGNEPLGGTPPPSTGLEPSTIPPIAGLGPHTLLYSNGEAGCMSDDAASERNKELILFDSNQNHSFEDMLLGQGLYYEPNLFYDAVKATKGIWAPLRPCCIKNGSCSIDNNVEADLSAACSQATAGSIVKVAPFTDNDGRLLCDVGGRSKREQMSYYIDQILERNSYVLVE